MRTESPAEQGIAAARQDVLPGTLHLTTAGRLEVAKRALEAIARDAPEEEPEYEEWGGDTEAAETWGSEQEHYRLGRIAREALTVVEADGVELVVAASRVVECWESGDLAGAVRDLAALLGRGAS